MGKCPKCTHTYLVRTDPETHEKVVVDQKGAERIEKIYELQGAEKRLEEQLRWEYKDFDSLYEHSKQDLTREWLPKVGQAPRHADILWRVAHVINDRLAKAGDLQAMSQIYFQLALYIHEIGKDAQYLQKLARKMELQNYAQSSAVTRVGILAAKDSCASCLKLNSQNFTLATAIKEQPLPCTDCTFRLNKTSPTGWCRCVYLPYTD